MKTILIPIDFRVESLNTLKYTLSSMGNERVNVVLMYAVNLQQSISDLLFYSRNRIIAEANNQPFEEALSILYNRFACSIETLRIEVFHGNNRQSFIQFAKTQGIDEVFVCNPSVLKPSKAGFNPTDIINKSGLPVQEIRWDYKASQPTAYNHLDLLFNHL